MRVILPVASALSAGLLLSACSSGDRVSYDSGGVTHTFQAGSDAAKVGFPIPVYPNAKVPGSVGTQGGDEMGNFMMLTSSDPVEKIRDYYQKELTKAGWQVKELQLAKELVNLAAHKDKLEASVMVSGDGNSTSITLTVAREPEGEPKVTNEIFIPDKLNPPTD